MAVQDLLSVLYPYGAVRRSFHSFCGINLLVISCYFPAAGRRRKVERYIQRETGSMMTSTASWVQIMP